MIHEWLVIGLADVKGSCFAYIGSHPQEVSAQPTGHPGVMIHVRHLSGMAGIFLQTEHQEEVDAIRAAVQLCVDGITFSNIEKLDADFHKDWHMTGFFEDGMYQRIDREQFIRMIGSNPPRTENDPVFEGGIVDIQYYGKTAVVKVRVENERVIFADHLSLLKIDGDWTIVHKIWDTEL